MFIFLHTYIALTYIPGGGLLTDGVCDEERSERGIRVIRSLPPKRTSRRQGAGIDLRKSVAIPLMGSTSDQSRALSVASRAGVSLKTRDKCGLGQLRVATDGPRPGERQRRRGGELVIHRKRPGARNRASRRRGAPTGYLDLPSSSLFLPFPFPSLPALRPAPAAPFFFSPFLPPL